MRYLSVLLMTVLFFAGCSKKSEKDLLDAADQKLKNNDIAGAIVEFNNYLTEFPEGQAASKVTFDLAKIYQSKLDKSMEGTASLKKSVEMFQQVVSKFPKSKEAPTALFMAAFVTANELNDMEGAKTLYQKFVDTFPGHELANSAKAELATLGLTPEQIIESKKVAEKK